MNWRKCRLQALYQVLDPSTASGTSSSTGSGISLSTGSGISSSTGSGFSISLLDRHNFVQSKQNGEEQQWKSGLAVMKFAKRYTTSIFKIVLFYFSLYPFYTSSTFLFYFYYLFHFLSFLLHNNNNNTDF